MKYSNLAHMFFDKRRQVARRPAFKFKKEGQWHTISFGKAVDKAERLSAGLAAIGLQKGDRVAIISNNRYEWALSDYASLALGCIVVPVYPTLPAHQVEYLLNDSEAKLVFAEDLYQIQKVFEINSRLKHLKQIVVYDTENLPETHTWMSFEALLEKGNRFLGRHGEYVQKCMAAVQRNDRATIIYTSGTTGEPKGAILTHGNFLSNVENVSRVFEIFPEDRLLSFLPLSHVLERMAGHYLSMFHGCMVAYAESIEAIPENILEIQPTIMISVPRLYEKIHAKIIDQVETGSALKRIIFYRALNIGKKYVTVQMNHERIPVILRVKHRLAYYLVYRKIQAGMGGKIRFLISGGAPLPKEIGLFFGSMGILILEGYGLTETSPAITLNRLDRFRFGSAGLGLPDQEIKIAEDGEILSRGPHIMVGYYKKERETAEAIDSDGWFHTGDIGLLSEDGFLTITDRKKNIIVTSGGKNIAPQPIENALTSSTYIDQAVVIGDRRKYCTALIVPAREALLNMAARKQIEFDDWQGLIRDEAIIRFFEKEVQRLIASFASYEQIKYFRIIDQPFTIENGQLTPTLKIKRKVVEKVYAEEIESMYP